MTPATHDFSVVRGSAAAAREFSPLIFRVKSGSEAVPFDDIQLSVYSKKSNDVRGTFLFRCSVADGGLVETDEYSGEVAWFPTPEQTRTLLVGAKNYYELELRDGASEFIFLLGTLTGIGGLNDDEGS